MALTRRALKAMGIEEEKIDEIISMHTDTVDGLKEQVRTYKADAEKLPSVQQELDTLKQKGDDGYKEKYEKEHSDFEAYKSDITKKQAKAAKEAAAKAYYESKGITGDNLTIAMMGSGATLEQLELDGDKIKDSAALDSLVNGAFAKLVSTTKEKGVNTENPPAAGSGKMTREDIVKIQDPVERRAAIRDNMELFTKG